ncbi:MAG: hypothetical protein J5806_10700 [Lentisphaeria bacterium]|nr:hypothetical protein [Lentisphaeria bacterium]
MNRCRKKFFTLLEVLVSMGVFAILMLALMQFFSTAQGVWEKTGNRAEVFDSARVALEMMAADLSSAYYRDDFDQTNYQYFSCESNVLVFAAEKEEGNSEICYKLDGNGRLLRCELKESTQFSSQANPVWFTRASSATPKAWITEMTTKANAAADADVILENVLSFTVTTYKDSTHSAAVPSSDGKIQIPYMVRILLVVVSRDALEKLAARGKNFAAVKTLYSTGTLATKIQTGVPPNDDDADTDEMLLFRGCQVFNRVVIIDRGQN